VLDVALGEGAGVDDLAAALELVLFLAGFLAAFFGALVVVTGPTGAGEEREPHDESKELEAPALSSHVEDLLGHGR